MKYRRLGLGWLLLLGLAALACRQTISDRTPDYQPPLPAPTQTGAPSTEPAPPASTAALETGETPAALETTAAPGPQPVEPELPTLAAQYEMDVLFDPASHSIQVAQQIRYTNLSPDTLLDLLLIVEPNRQPGEFALETVQWQAGAPVKDYRLRGERLEIPLPQPLLPGESLGLRLRYSLGLPSLEMPSDALRAVAYGYSARQDNFVDWYPFLPFYRAGEGWLVNPAGKFGEHLVYDSADFAVTIHFNNPQQRIPLAASAPPEAADGGWRYELRQARSFSWSASEHYQVISQTVGSAVVYSYFFPGAERGGQAALQATAQALALYSEHFGEYPYPSLSVVEADFNDGMEYAGLYFLSRDFYAAYDNTPANYLTLIAAHETAHQWWYGWVGDDPANQPWLDEALATYCELLFYERYYPDLSEWWWQFRVDPYQPQGSLAQRIYDFSSFRAYRDGIYLRGAQFLSELRQELGDEGFFWLLQQMVQQYGYQIATTDGFFAILEGLDAGVASRLQAKYFAP